METIKWIFPFLIGVWKVSEGHPFTTDLDYDKPHSPSNNPISPWIVGGEKVNPGEIPYQLSLRWDDNRHFCGASLVQVNGQQIAITAAHCVNNESRLKLVGGTVKSVEQFQYEQTRHVVSIKIHPGYGKYALNNDIALLFLDEPFKLDSYVNTISLPEPGTKTMSDVLVSGWGVLSTNGKDIPENLLKVRLPIVSTERCKKSYANIIRVGDSHLCAGTIGKSACYGDSGGPVTNIGGTYLAGIVAGGIGCGDYAKYPGVYTNVAYFIPWINHSVPRHITFSWS